MKKMIAAFLLCILFKPVSYSQIYDLVSHLNGWSGTNVTNSFNCPTFDYMCLHNAPCSLGPDWGRIGTPNAAVGKVGAVSNNGVVEGLYTSVNWIPGEIYNIHVAVSGLSYSGSSADGRLKLYATKYLHTTTLANLNCQEGELSNTTFWTTIGNCPPTYNAYEIADMPLNASPKVYNFSFHVPPGFSYNQFAVYPYFNNGGDQVDVEFDYIIIERACAPFGYVLDTRNIYNVDFYSTPARNSGMFTWYNWDFGDGATGSGQNVTHGYNPPIQWVPPINYNACLEMPDGNNEPCRSCRNICMGHISKEASCDIISDFSIDFPGPYPNINFASAYNYATFLIEWGDGTSQDNNSTPGGAPYASHVYAIPGTYNICFTAYGESSDCYSKTCLEVCIDEAPFDGTSVTEDQQATFVENPDGRRAQFTSQAAQPAKAAALNAISSDVIVIQPNPVATDATVSFKAMEKTTAEITVYDVRGKKIAQEVKQTSIGSNQAIVDLSQAPAGVYLLEIKTGSRVERRRMVKQ